MRFFSHLSVRAKLVGLIAIQLVVLGGVFMIMFQRHARHTAREDAIAQASRVIDMAESVRHGMSEKWKAGVFDQETVRKWADEGMTERVIGSVPIVSAWQAVMRKAEAGGYEFKTPRENPRNPSNQPNALERRALASFAKSPGLKEYIEVDHDTNRVHYLRPVRLSQECMMCHGEPSTSLALWGNEQGMDPTGFHMEGLKVGDMHGAFEVIQSLDAADARAAKATFQGLVVVMTFILIGCGLLVWILNRSLLRPLAAASEAFARLVDGDLQGHLNVTSNDEIGALQKGINAMLHQLRDMILNLRSSSEQLGGVSGGLEQTAVKVQSSATETCSRSDTVASAAEEMNQGLTVMRDSLQNLSMKVQNVAAASSQVQGNAEVVSGNTDQTALLAREASQLAGRGGEQVQYMEDAAKSISEIIDVIQGISDQTHLLALNATIEASRAGEAGKGFEVVASEVKMLAQQTSDATGEIRNRIESIQAISATVVETIHDIESAAGKVSSSTDEVSGAVVEQRATIQRVTEQLNEAAQLTELVTHSVEENVIAANEVSQSIHDVHTIAVSTSSEVDATKRAGDELRQVSSSFRQLLGKFSV